MARREWEVDIIGFARTRTLYNACNRGHRRAYLGMKCDHLIPNSNIAEQSPHGQLRIIKTKHTWRYGEKAYHDAIFTTTPSSHIVSDQESWIFGFRLEITK